MKRRYTATDQAGPTVPTSLARWPRRSERREHAHLLSKSSFLISEVPPTRRTICNKLTRLLQFDDKYRSRTWLTGMKCRKLRNDSMNIRGAVGDSTRTAKTTRILVAF